MSVAGLPFSLLQVNKFAKKDFVLRKYNSIEIVEKTLSVALTSYTSCIHQADLRINHITFQINMENVIYTGNVCFQIHFKEQQLVNRLS